MDQSSGPLSDHRADRLFSNIHNTVKSEINESNKKVHILSLISILEHTDQKPLALKLRNQLKGIGVGVISEPVRGIENTSFYNDQHRMSCKPFINTFIIITANYITRNQIPPAVFLKIIGIVRGTTTTLFCVF